jgi:hypothetical protein
MGESEIHAIIRNLLILKNFNFFCINKSLKTMDLFPHDMGFIWDFPPVFHIWVAA